MSLKKYIFMLLLSVVASLHAKTKKPFTFVIDPAGDALHAGRKIDDCYERTITLQCAQALKKELEKRTPDKLILLTRLPGQQKDQLEKARFANQLPADIYVSLHAYQTTALKVQLHVYYYAQPYQETYQSNRSCMLIQNAHLMHQHEAKKFADHITHAFATTPLARLVDIHTPMGIPCLPCKGILAPALCIELGLQKSDDWIKYIEPLTEALSNV